MSTTRRRFMWSSTAAAALGLPSLAGLRRLKAADPDGAEPASDRIRFDSDLEPLVRLIEETPRDKCVQVLAEQLRRGLSYRQFLAAVFFSTIRRQNPHHSAYRTLSVHQVSLDLPQADRLLPLFWAVDGFKRQQEDFPTAPVAPLAGQLPAADKAAAEFQAAMQMPDDNRAERAVVALVRSQGPRQALEQLWPYGCRSVSLIGHRAISLSNCARVLEVVGWRHAEHVFRFVVWDLYSRGGGEDQYYRPNIARAEQLLEKLPADWAAGKSDRAAVVELFAVLRTGKAQEACDLAGQQLTRGVGAQAIWDAVHVAAAEVLLLHGSATAMAGRPLHANTAMNALHHAYSAALSPRSRLLNLLQAVAWVADFISVQLGASAVTEMTDLAGEEVTGPAAEAVQEIFAALPPRTYQYDSQTKTGAGHVLVDRPARMKPIRRVFALATKSREAGTLFQRAALSWLTLKATVEAHEYKLPAALFEDSELVSPEWRPRLLAASAHWLHGPQSADSVVIQQAREELKIS